jgi:hypothetical protein
MQKFLFCVFCLLLTTIPYAAREINKQLPPVKQGIEGYIYRISGNQMPSPNRLAAKPHGIQTTLFIYEATNTKDVVRKGTSAFYLSISKKLISTVLSDSSGHFAIELPIGSYSLFTKVNGLLYANSFDVENNIGLVKVIKGKVTSTIIRIDAGASY